MTVKRKEKKIKTAKIKPVKKKKAVIKPSKPKKKKVLTEPAIKRPVLPSANKALEKKELPEVPPKKAPHPSHIYDKYDNKFQDFYGDTRIVLMPRDPYWLFAYWEVSLPRIEEAKKVLGNEFGSATSILRVYDVSKIIFNGKNAHSYFELTLKDLIRSRYINIPEPEKDWIVDIGILTHSGRFFVLARSNSAATPAGSRSNVELEEWLDSSEPGKIQLTHSAPFEVKSGPKGGGPVYDPAGIYGREGRTENTSFSGSSNMAGPVKYNKTPSVFWMRVGTELIVYGAAGPGSAVTINNAPVSLNPDGSFSARFALSGDLHVLNISSRSASGNYKKTFKIRVDRETYKEE